MHSRRIALLLLVLASCAHGRPSAIVSNRALDPGPFPVGHVHVTLVDTSRPTARNKDYPGSPSRKLETQIWYPAEPRAVEWLRIDAPPIFHGAPHPLIIYSHGFMSFNSEGQYLAKHLASLGYVVVAADYPLTNYFAPGGPMLADVVNQPGDVSFLIDTLLAWSSDPKNRLAGGVDAKRIGVAGVSLGGLTSMLAAFHPKLHDARVAAVISMAGPNSMLGASFFQAAPKPFMMIAGDIDAIVPYDVNAATLQQRAPFATLVTLRSGSHAGYAEITSSALFANANNPDDLGCDALMKKLDIPSSGEIFGALGGADSGIIPADTRKPCQSKTLPRAMRPAREQELTTLAATSFFQSIFGDDETIRATNKSFLQATLAAENDDALVSPPVQAAP